ncbi:MAG: GNVR domain-containing protein [Candidatus Zixiibacteriota bacterium]
MRRTAPETVSPFWESFVLPVLRYKKMSYVIVATTMLVTLGYCLLLPNKYTSVATILPSGGGDELSDLKELAGGSLAELGLGAFTQSSENSSAIFPKVLTSRLLSEQILNHRFDFSHKGKTKSLTLLEYLDAANIDLGIRQLSKIAKVDLDRRTGYITLSATTTYPALSSLLVKTYLQLLDDYNIYHRQSKARENEKFISKRAVEAAAELTLAENNLEEFQEINRNYTTSSDPVLRNEMSKLEREVSVKETIYLTLVKKHELAKLEAAKDVPIVQVLDNGAAPQIKSSPRRSLYLLAALVSSILDSIILSLWFDLSVKRSFRANLEQIMASPEIQIGRFESQIVDRATRLARIIENPVGIRKTDKATEQND